MAGTATLMTLLVATPAAFVLSRERFRGRTAMLGALPAMQTISPIVLLLPRSNVLGTWFQAAGGMLIRSSGGRLATST